MPIPLPLPIRFSQSQSPSVILAPLSLQSRPLRRLTPLMPSIPLALPRISLLRTSLLLPPLVSLPSLSPRHLLRALSPFQLSPSLFQARHLRDGLRLGTLRPHRLSQVALVLLAPSLRSLFLTSTEHQARNVPSLFLLALSCRHPHRPPLSPRLRPLARLVQSSLSQFPTAQAAQQPLSSPSPFLMAALTLGRPSSLPREQRVHPLATLSPSPLQPCPLVCPLRASTQRARLPSPWESPSAVFLPGFQSLSEPSLLLPAPCLREFLL
ncbi:hypothetical protein V8F20_004224 [Naviculisporaceae sp. PSN 640]